MVTDKVIPSLSQDGWVDSSLKLADYLLSHFFLSDYSQTYLYEGNVSSLPWIIQHTQNNMTETTSLTQSTLSNYFKRYFDVVTVQVVEVPNDKDPSFAQISIYLSFTDSVGITYKIDKIIDIVNSKIHKIIALNNG